MYKDPDKQREANRKAQAKFKAKQGITKEGEMPKGITEKVLLKARQEGITTIIPEDVVMPKVESHVDASDISVVKALHQLIKPKRGKDINYFEDLLLDVQRTINHLSWDNSNKVFSQEERDKRTTRAIQYLHLFPSRFHSTGVT